MNIYWLIYLIDRVEIIHSISTVISTMSGMMLLISFILVLAGKMTLATTTASWTPKKEVEQLTKWLVTIPYNIGKKALLVLLISMPFYILTPSKDTVILLSGVYVANQTEVPQKILVIINKQLDNLDQSLTELTKPEKGANK